MSKVFFQAYKGSVFYSNMLMSNEKLRVCLQLCCKMPTFVAK